MCSTATFRSAFLARRIASETRATKRLESSTKALGGESSTTSPSSASESELADPSASATMALRTRWTNIDRWHGLVTMSLAPEARNSSIVSSCSSSSMIKHAHLRQARLASHGAAELDRSPGGQAAVDHHQLEQPLADRVQGRGRVGRLVDLEARFLQAVREPFAVDAVGVSHEQASRSTFLVEHGLRPALGHLRPFAVLLCTHAQL